MRMRSSLAIASAAAIAGVACSYGLCLLGAACVCGIRPAPLQPRPRGPSCLTAFQCRPCQRRFGYSAGRWVGLVGCIWARNGSWSEVVLGQTETSGDDVAGHVGDRALVAEGVGPEAGEGVVDRGGKAVAQDPGGLVYFRPMKRSALCFAAAGIPCQRFGTEQSGECQGCGYLLVAHRTGLSPMAHHRADADRSKAHGEGEDSTHAKPQGVGGESWPARGRCEVGTQDRPVAGGGVEDRPFSRRVLVVVKPGAGLVAEPGHLEDGGGRHGEGDPVDAQPGEVDLAWRHPASNLEVRHTVRRRPGLRKQIRAAEPSGDGWLQDLTLESELKDAEIRDQVMSFSWRTVHRTRG
ncbi:hypothetical protein C791_1871 [Amycolatopsis azurea DSM 43854]|uniref:Uncharacterized protein n=1 Tax=Amycolatopsis azurea DSM 43854 TaxID=1238180 RepID=M2Q6H3_9PSEU|nr:hypothetical protein C791_1871 [Amycolatopsis azurea DSM 43854]